MKLTSTVIISLLLWIAIATLGRLIPHPPNATPLASLAILSAVMLRKPWAIGLTLVSLCLSDIILGYLNHSAIWGTWSWFTYSGYLALALCAPSQGRLSILLPYTLFATFGYWLWTNFGTWLEGLMYPYSWQGLVNCYVAGLPFLRNAVLGNLIYLVVLWFALQKLRITVNMSAQHQPGKL
jgi:hypothetical protein